MLVLSGLPTSHEAECEKLFSDSCSREEAGAYTVRLLFAAEVNTEMLDDTRTIATKRLHHLEAQLLYTN